ncbi:hypothetical protein GQ457_01G005090 [Hibiscus cannabinus]
MYRGTVKRKQRKLTKTSLESRLQVLEDCDPDEETLAELVEVKLGLNIEADKEESCGEQRSRVNWLMKGDKNTSFFHNFANSRKKTNKIDEIIDQNGNLVSSMEGVLQTASSYFAELFTASSMGDTAPIYDNVKEKITPAMNTVLMAPFVADEVKVALSTMSPLKASGLDGFPALFFQSFWPIVGQEVIDFCLSVLNGHAQLAELNRTHIILIPKIKHPRTMAHFRPISLCNVLYKLIAKVLVLRMQVVLHCCIVV